VALSKIITDAVHTAQPLVHAKGHELTVTQARESLHVHGDLTRLTQIVSNLLNNAAKYMHQGGKIVLTTERIGDTVAIRVEDDGNGIAPEMLPRICELFVQADNSLDRTHGGLGIGLTLVKSLVEMHGGTVEATSDGMGKGSRFTVRLPILQAGDVVHAEATGFPDIRRRPEWNDICLVAVTGYGQESDKKLAKEAGFNTHVVKPISKGDLEGLLASLAYLK